jgi:hypothetical protein
MNYTSEAAIIIGGKTKAIWQFAKYLLTLKIQDNNDLLPEFRVVKIEPDLSIFVFYQSAIAWDDETDAFWRTLRKEADKAKLSYIFLRAGENLEDTVMLNNCETSNVDVRLSNLINIVRHINMDTKLINKLIN